MRLKKVESSNVDAVGYDKKKQELHVRFKASKANETLPLYSYSGIPPEVAEALVKAESVGGYLAKNIKGRYDFERITPKGGKP